MTAEDLRHARSESANVAYQTFVKHIDQDKTGFFSFYEGKDAPYYYLRIKSVLPKSKIYPIECKGKAMVVKVNELISNHSEYAKYKKGFFVDKDFDPSIKTTRKDIYETPCYSIENLYICPDVFESILKNELGLTEVEGAFIAITKLYQSLLVDVLNGQTLFNAWYCALKEKKFRDSLSSTNVYLNEKFPKGYMVISLDGIKINYDLARIRNDFPTAIPIRDDEVDELINRFSSANRRHEFRGKYLMEFLYQFILQLIEDSNTTQTHCERKLKFTLPFNQIISQFSQYAETPDCLIEYLESFRENVSVA